MPNSQHGAQRVGRCKLLLLEFWERKKKSLLPVKIAPLVQIQEAISAGQRLPEGLQPEVASNEIALVIWMLLSPDCSSQEK